MGKVGWKVAARPLSQPSFLPEEAEDGQESVNSQVKVMQEQCGNEFKHKAAQRKSGRNSKAWRRKQLEGGGEIKLNNKG